MKIFEFRYKSFNLGHEHYLIEKKGEQFWLDYEYHVGDKIENDVRMLLDSKQMENFYQNMINANVLDWNDDYFNLDRSEGVSWEMFMELNGDVVKTRGWNEYPANWDAFIRCIYGLCNKQRQVAVAV